MKNDKLNSAFSFPQVLDLQPYSYYGVMEREGRLMKNAAEEGEEVTEVIDEDFIQPIHEDCFEYKLVGVNVHSGSAEAGHYWSYINTNRGIDETDENWLKTENDPWMEFNDSIVNDYSFANLAGDTTGDDASTKTKRGMFGDKYGKSAYMLFYERRKKKDLKMVIS